MRGRPKSHQPKPGAPLRWTPRHHRLVELAVLGLTNNEIAEKLSYSPTRVSQLLNHYDIITAIAELRATSRARSMGALQDDLAHDARNTFDKLRVHRDAEDPDVSLRACGMLWDRQIPKRTEVQEEKTLRIILSREDQQYLRQVAAEDDAAMDAEYTVEDPDAPSTPHGS